MVKKTIQDELSNIIYAVSDLPEEDIMNTKAVKMILTVFENYLCEYCIDPIHNLDGDFSHRRCNCTECIEKIFGQEVFLRHDLENQRCVCCYSKCSERYIIRDEENKEILDGRGNKQYLCCECSG